MCPEVHATNKTSLWLLATASVRLIVVAICVVAKEKSCAVRSISFFINYMHMLGHAFGGLGPGGMGSYAPYNKLGATQYCVGRGTADPGPSCMPHAMYGGMQWQVFPMLGYGAF